MIYREEGLVGGFVLQMHPDVFQHERYIYSTLDWLGDIGGLKEALSNLGSLALFLLGQGGGLTSHLVSQLFKVQSKEEKEKADTHLKRG